MTHDAAATVKRVTLELGGKSPNIVFADCDLEAMVTASVQECMFNTGQSCDSPARLLVERSCYDEALKIVKTAAEAVEGKLAILKRKGITLDLCLIKSNLTECKI